MKYVRSPQGQWLIHWISLAGPVVLNGALQEHSNGVHLVLRYEDGTPVPDHLRRTAETEIPAWAMRWAEAAAPQSDTARTAQQVDDTVRIARLMFEDEDGGSWSNLDPESRRLWRARARSALDAMGGVEPCTLANDQEDGDGCTSGQ